MKITHLIATGIAVLSLPTIVLAAFRDVPPNHANADAIAYVQSQGIVNGYADGTFHADAPINRAEFTKIVTLYKFGQQMIDMCGSRMQFTDLAFDAWYVKYICRAKDGGLISGYPDGTFRPEQNINFAEAAKIIARTDIFNAGDPVLPKDLGGPWYDIYLSYLSYYSEIPLSISSVDHTLTRGEMAEIIYRLRNKDHLALPSKKYDSVSGQLTFNNTSGTTKLRPYHNSQLGYDMSYPSAWTVQENTTFDGGNYSANGTSFTFSSAPIESATLHIGTASSCPTFDKPLAVILYGKQFSSGVWGDNASGGQRGVGVTLAGKISDGRCLIITKFVAYHDYTGFVDNFDSSALESAKIGVQETLNEMIASYFSTQSTSSIALSQEKIYSYGGTVLRFRVSNEWPYEEQVGPVNSDSGLPQVASLWRININSTCKGCAEGEYPYNFTIDAYTSDPALTDSLTPEHLVNVLRDYTQGSTRIIVYTEGGMCGSKGAFLITGKIDYKLMAKCGDDGEDSSKQFDQILATMSAKVGSQ